MKDNRKRFVDTWTTNNYHVLTESEEKQYHNESAFQQIYSTIDKKFPESVLCVIEGRWSKNNAESVNGRFYGDFWDKQLAKEQTQFLLRKGLMWMLFGHVDREIQDKDLEEGIVAGIVTHLEVIKQPITLHGKDYKPGDLFGRAIIVQTGGKNAGLSTYALLQAGVDLSISSRGLGEYIIGETHTCEDGRQIPIMNPDTYELETFDFTRLPGIECAEVHMVQDNKRELTESIQENDEMLEDDEDDFTFESLDVSESSLNRIKESLDSLIFNIQVKENEMPKVDGIKVQQVLEDANAKIASLTAKLEAAEEEIKELKAKEEEPKNEAVEAGEQPEETATPAEVKAEETPSVPANTPVVDTTNLAGVTVDNNADIEALAKYKDIAETPEELNNTLIKTQEALNRCKEDAEELAKTKDELAKAKEECAEKDKDIADMQSTLESYVKLGSIADLQAIVESNQKMANEARRQKLIAFTEHYSVRKGITQESVKRIIESSKSIKDAKAVLESLPNKNANAGLYRKPESKDTINAAPALSSFAESFIKKAEARRNRKFSV